MSREPDRVHLPVIDRPSSLRSDGQRVKIIPADVKGRFTSARRVLFAVLLVLGVSLPMIRIQGRPAMFLDVPARRFFLFGESYNAQDAWLVFFLLTGLGFSLLVLTTTLGRAWCGWTCPQTVLLEGLYRPIERFIEGPRNTHVRRDAGPRTWDRAGRKVVKHTIFIVVSLLLSNLVVAYFVSMPSLGAMITEGPWAHPIPFAWTIGVGLLLYIDGSWFREQLCLIVCPYGRLQSVLIDNDSLVVGYDEKRGEPRGKGKDRENLGDCVDCGRCVAVCPTGIDIRHGLQLDCIACTQCIDACDEVMDKLSMPRGLVRYDSLRGLSGKARRFWRPRLGFYAILGVIGVGVLVFALSRRHTFEANLLRARGAPFVVEDGLVRNTYEVHLINKEDHPIELHLDPEVDAEWVQIGGAREATLQPLQSMSSMLVVRVPTANVRPGLMLRLHISSGEDDNTVEAPVLGPTVAH